MLIDLPSDQHRSRMMKTPIASPVRAFRQFLYATRPPVWGCLALLLLVSIWSQSIPAGSDLARQLASEDGLFEHASAGFLVAASLLAFVTWVCTRAYLWLSGGVVILYAALRELDIQTMFTYRSVMSTGYYFSGKAALGERFLVVLVLLPCLVSIVCLLRAALLPRGRLSAPGALTERLRAASRSWLIWILLLFALSHVLDRNPTALAWMPGDLHVLEALVEAGLCLLILLLVVELKPRFLRA